MRLKSLILSGFKSFPKRTVLNFSGGINAIVGPNGSGKSNIVDAIRWVLGEQNPRLLRAGKMEELIFSGNGKVEVNSASVKLKLEDCKEMAPPELKDFSEIEIERIVFKDGSSKFLLNGKNCRLKEIRYLFLDTGAGTRAYSIIDQGRVEQFVSMSPEERRLIVEEVAGISRYKERRAQAAFRMKTTKENLERLEDVLSEVKRQTNSLSRQAKKAQRFVELRKKEEELALLVLKLRLIEINDTFLSLKERLSSLKAEKEGFEAEHSKVQTAISKVEVELEELFLKEKDARKSERELKTERDRLFKRLSMSERELAVSDEKKSSILAGLNESKERICDLKKKITINETKVKTLEKEKRLLSERLKEVELKEKHAQKEFNKIKKRREELKNRYVFIVSKKATISSKISGLEDRIFSLEGKLERFSDRQKILDEKRRKILSDQESVQDILSNTKEKIEKLTNNIIKLEKDISGLDKEEEEKKQLFFTNTGKLQELKAKLNAFLDLEEQGVGFLEGVKRFVKKTEASTLSDMLEVYEGYEWAFEVALGNTLQAIVPKDESEYKRFLDMIFKAPEEYVGVGIIFPFKKSFVFKKELHRDSLLMKVTRQENLSKGLVEYLSKWKIIESVKRIDCDQNNDQIFLSKDGFIVFPWGEIRNIKNIKKDEGILYRKKQIKRLQASIESLDKKIAVIRTEINSISKRKKEYLKTLQDVKQEMRLELSKKEQFEKKLIKLNNELINTKETIDLLLFEKQESEEELYNFQKDLNKLQTDLKKITIEEKTCNDLLKIVEKDYSDQEAEISLILEEKSISLVKLKELDTKYQSYRKEEQRLKKTLNFLEQKVQKDSKTLDVLCQKENLLKKDIEELKNELYILDNNLIKIQRTLKSYDEKIDGFRKRLHELQNQRSSIRARLNTYLDEIHKLELSISETVKQKEHIFDICKVQFRKDPVILNNIVVSGLKKDEVESELQDVRRKIKGFGPVNLTAMDEFKEQKKRYDFLESQREDLLKSLMDIEDAIKRIDEKCKERLKRAIEDINASLHKVFSLLFEGGKAWLSPINKEQLLESGIELNIKIPGKRISNLSLLSGGEKALCAIALIFAIFFIKPTPFCILDEVDAPLDESNTIKFNSLVKQVSGKSQVILVTHNQKVMEVADSLYGVTMEDKGVSKLVTVELVS